MEIKDFDAALEYYTFAIDKLRDVPSSDLSEVIVDRDGSFVLAKIKAVDVPTKVAFVEFLGGDAANSSSGVALETVTPIHQKQFALQGTLHANRARVWIQA